MTRVEPCSYPQELNQRVSKILIILRNTCKVKTQNMPQEKKKKLGMMKINEEFNMKACREVKGMPTNILSYITT